MPLHTDFNLSGAAFFINMDDTNDFFYIGYISRSRGLKGEIQLFFEFSDYEELDLDVLFLEMDRKMVPFFVDTAKIQQNSTAYIFLEDIDHIEKAQPLLHKRVYLPKAKRPERDPDDFRFTDLVGFEAHDSERGPLGKIHAVHSYPQQFVAAVTYQEKEILFPLNEATIVLIDNEKELVQLTLPDGLIDLYLS